MVTTSDTKLGELSSWSCWSCKNCSSNTPCTPQKTHLIVSWYTILVLACTRITFKAKTLLLILQKGERSSKFVHNARGEEKRRQTWWKSKASRRFMSARKRSAPHPSNHSGRPVLAVYLNKLHLLAGNMNTRTPIGMSISTRWCFSGLMLAGADDWRWFWNLVEEKSSRGSPCA